MELWLIRALKAWLPLSEVTFFPQNPRPVEVG